MYKIILAIILTITAHSSTAEVMTSNIDSVKAIQTLNKYFVIEERSGDNWLLETQCPTEMKISNEFDMFVSSTKIKENTRIKIYSDSKEWVCSAKNITEYQGFPLAKN